MRMMTIASGSSGNCIYVGSDDTHILIDAGISRKRIVDGLKTIDVDIKDIDAVLVTHEHSDHISGLGVLSRKDNIPIYATRGTIAAIKQASSIGSIADDIFNAVSADVGFVVKDISIDPFTISHDASEPVAYSMVANDKKVCVATDLGMYDDYIIEKLSGANGLVIEANHDVNLLQVGTYPYQLKQRILSDKGHLSNDSCGALLDRILHPDMRKVFLGHLSKENNYDKLAFETVRCAINLSASDYRAEDFDISVADRSCVSELVDL